jgi:hypothetical protein
MDCKKRNILVSTITNKVLELVIMEISKDDMKETIKTKIIQLANIQPKHQIRKLIL